MEKNSIKILNINKKLLSVYEGNGIITFFLQTNRRCSGYQDCEPSLATSSFRLQAYGLRTFYFVEYKKGYLQLYRRFQFYFHTSGVSKNNIKLNPGFVSGFIDGEGLLLRLYY